MNLKSIVLIITILSIITFSVVGYFLFNTSLNSKWNEVNIEADSQKAETTKNQLKKILFLNDILDRYDSFMPEKRPNNSMLKDEAHTKDAIKKFSVDLKTVRFDYGKALASEDALRVRGERATMKVSHFTELLAPHNLDLLELEVLTLRKANVETYFSSDGKKQLVHQIEIIPRQEKRYETISIPFSSSYSADKIIINVTPLGKRKKVRFKIRGIHLLSRAYKTLENMPRVGKKTI